jgi:hypothetical protein
VSDYLFDKEGDPDPEIERLEQLLAPLAYRGTPPPVPRRLAPVRSIAFALAALSALLLVLVLRPWRPALPSWAAVVRDGNVTRDGQPIHGEVRVPVGVWIESGTGHVELKVADIGTVSLQPGTRARIVASGPAQHRMQLERGTLRAEVTAPPRHFAVETRHTVVTDLGCAFELTVDDAGRGSLVVTAGAVGLSRGSDEVTVPAGAECALTDAGPGTPHALGAVQPVEAPAASPAKPAHEPKPAHPPKAQPKPTHTPKVTHHPKPAAKTSSHPPTAPVQKATPAHKPDPGVKLQHDPLRDLERSGPAQ